jgi:hypothetical protein
MVESFDVSVIVDIWKMICYSSDPLFIPFGKRGAAIASATINVIFYKDCVDSRAPK